MDENTHECTQCLSCPRGRDIDLLMQEYNLRAEKQRHNQEVFRAVTANLISWSLIGGLGYIGYLMIENFKHLIIKP